MDVYKAPSASARATWCALSSATGSRSRDNVDLAPGSQITATGVVTSAQEEQSPFTQAITGGTGVYRKRTGS